MKIQYQIFYLVDHKEFSQNDNTKILNPVYKDRYELAVFDTEPDAMSFISSVSNGKIDYTIIKVYS